MDIKFTGLNYFLNNPTEHSSTVKSRQEHASLGPPYLRASEQQASVLRLKRCES